MLTRECYKTLGAPDIVGWDGEGITLKPFSHRLAKNKGSSYRNMHLINFSQGPSYVGKAASFEGQTHTLAIFCQETSEKYSQWPGTPARRGLKNRTRANALFRGFTRGVKPRD